MSARRVRIGIDTGGTFTDVVAVDEETGAVATTKTPSPPADPADGFLAGVQKVLGQLGLDGSAVTAVSHGTTVATNQLLEGKLDRIGFITTEGYEAVLETPRPDSFSPPGGGTGGCGNPPASRCPTATATATSGSSRRGSSRPTWCAPSAVASTTPAPRCARSTRTTPAPPPGSSRTRASPRSASASCTPTRTTRTSAGCSTCSATSTRPPSCP